MVVPGEPDGDWAETGVEAIATVTATESAIGASTRFCLDNCKWTITFTMPPLSVASYLISNRSVPHIVSCGMLLKNDLLVCRDPSVYSEMRDLFKILFGRPTDYRGAIIDIELSETGFLFEEIQVVRGNS